MLLISTDFFLSLFLIFQVFFLLFHVWIQCFQTLSKGIELASSEPDSRVGIQGFRHCMLGSVPPVPLLMFLYSDSSAMCMCEETLSGGRDMVQGPLLCTAATGAGASVPTWYTSLSVAKAQGPITESFAGLPYRLIYKINVKKWQPPFS